MNRTLIVGDTLDFPTVIPKYPASEGWTLVYRLIPRVSGTVITFAATADGDAYRAQQEASVTATWADGEYSWFADVSNVPGDMITVDQGVVTLIPNPRTVLAYDGRTPARVALDAMNAALNTFGTQAFANMANVASYSIGNRSMEFRQFNDQASFLAYRSLLKWEVYREECAEKMRAGMPNPRIVSTRIQRC